MSYQKVSPEYIEVEGSLDGYVLKSNGSNTYWSSPNFLSTDDGGTVNGDILLTKTLIVSNITPTTSNITGAIRTSGGIATTGNVHANTVQVDSHIDFGLINHPDFKEGRVFYDSEHKTLNFQTDVQNLNLEVGHSNYIRVFNDSGITLNIGSPVTINGVTDEGVPKVQYSDASSSSLYRTFGLVSKNIANSTYGLITNFGIIKELNTSNYTENQKIFVGFSSPGTLVQPSPEYPNYTMCVGFVLKSDSANGEILVYIIDESFDSLRVVGDVRIDGLLTASNLQILGTQTIVSINNLEVADNFIYLNGGDTINTVNSSAVTGLNDLTFKGHFTGTSSTTFYVEIDEVSPDTFKWSYDDFVTTEATGVTITGLEQTLSNGISLLFESTTGHTANDKWFGTASPVNIDFGLIGNRNYGSYTHAGLFFDVTDNKFKFFDKYDLEPEGDIDIGDSSFELSNLEAKTINVSFANSQTSNSITVNSIDVNTTNVNSSIGLFTSQTNSTSNVTGTVVVSGGVGIAGNLYCAGELVLDSGTGYGDIEGVRYIYANASNVNIVNVSSSIEFSSDSQTEAFTRAKLIAYNVFFS